MSSIFHMLRLRRLLAVVIPSVILLPLQYLTAVAQSANPVPINVQISFTAPAFVGMPIWVMVNTPSPHKIHYPASTAPSDFGCNKLEVMLDSHVLAPEEHPNRGGSSGIACGWVSAPNSPESRLPLHIQYPLTKPGRYLVRYTRYGVVVENGQIERQTLERSEWTPLELRGAPPHAVQEWLSSLLANLPTSPGILVGDALPSLLAQRSRTVLRTMLQATYNPDEVVSRYASDTIPMFEPSIVTAETLDAIRRRGPNETLADLFSSYGNILSPIAPDVANISAEYLRSMESLKVTAAAHMLYVLRQPYYHLKPELTQKLDSSVEGAANTVITQRNEKAAPWLAQYLANSKSATAHKQLWTLADARLATEQTLICVGWLHDSSDLPKIVSIVETYDPADPNGYKNSGVVGNLRYSYGDRVRPYLRDILRSSKQVWVRVAAAKELTLINDSAGYDFFLNTLREHPFYHDEMVRWLRDAFPAIGSADEPTIAKFLQTQRSGK